jgi:hypothetical protein
MTHLIHFIIFIKYNLFLLINPNKLDVLKVSNNGKQFIHRLTYDEVINLYNMGTQWRLNIMDLFNFKNYPPGTTKKEKDYD